MAEGESKLEKQVKIKKIWKTGYRKLKTGAQVAIEKVRRKSGGRKEP